MIFLVKISIKILVYMIFLLIFAHTNSKYIKDIYKNGKNESEKKN